MAERSSFGDVRLDVTAGRGSERGKPEPETPFRILVMGDFSGRANRPGTASRAARPVLVDRDNLDDTIRKLGVSLTLGGEDSSGISLRFQELDDFEPDRIYEQAGLFRKLREVRKPLADPARFESTAADYGLIQRSPSSAPRREFSTREPAAPRAQDLASGDLLSQMLDASEDTPSAASGRGAPQDDLSEFLRRAVEPYAVSDPHPKQAEVLSRWDEMISQQMRAVLHHADFQALEAAWRGLFLLTRRLETGTDLKVYLLDITRDELSADLRSPDLGATRLYQALAAGSGDPASQEPWAVLAGNYRFGAGRDEVELLARLAKLTEHLGAPFIAEAAPEVFGCSSISDLDDPSEWNADMDERDAAAWNALRGFPESRYLALAAPRFLLRLPYGRETVPTEEFPFEETPDAKHEDFLWGNPAFACACLLGLNFSEEGWDMRPGAMRRLDGIPLHVYKSDGLSEQLPGAEAWIGERAADALLAAGITPLLSVKGQDAIVLFNFRSLTTAMQSVAGPWS